MNLKMIRALFFLPGMALAVLFYAGICDEALAASRDYGTYTNARFGYCVEYPGGLVAGEAPVNNDGRTFTSKDGKVSLTVYGSFNALERTMQESFASYLEDYNKEGKKVTYKAGGEKWFVLSGLDGDRVFYIKTIRQKVDESDIDATFIFYYPRSEKAKYDAMTARIAKTFKFVSKGL
ncbi:MAG: hypothetical protein RDV48_12440 [Candidatus Eremiobacteraeota bacterium]|nr:hypothetical protein [Candidatus Eremiobacteraeota bacterium]